jgi:hypothetical protein
MYVLVVVEIENGLVVTSEGLRASPVILHVSHCHVVHHSQGRPCNRHPGGAAPMLKDSIVGMVVCHWLPARAAARAMFGGLGSHTAAWVAPRATPSLEDYRIQRCEVRLLI